MDVPAAPDRVIEATVDQLAGAELRLLGVPSDEAARRIALPSGHRGLVPSELRRTGKTLDSALPEKQPA